MRRARWRLIGAWRWPLFLVLTVADAAVVRALPPTGTGARFIPALIICSFGNIFLIGVVAPWFARRLAARRGERLPPPTFPPASSSEVLVDRVASLLLLLALVGLVVAGLGNRKVVIAATDAAVHAADASNVYVMAHAPGEIKRNFEGTANTYRLASNYFRICGAYDDRLRAYCMFVDTSHKPPLVRYDPETTPNAERFHETVGGGE